LYENRPHCTIHRFSNHNTINKSMEHHLPPWAPHITMVTLCKHQEAHFPHPRQIAYHLDHLICTILHPWKSHSLDIAHSNNHQWAKTFLLQVVALIDPLYSLFSLSTFDHLILSFKNIFHSHTYHRDGARVREAEMHREREREMNYDALTDTLYIMIWLQYMGMGSTWATTEPCEWAVSVVPWINGSMWKVVTEGERVIV